MTHRMFRIAPRLIQGLTLFGLVTILITDSATPLGFFAYGTLYPLLAAGAGLSRQRRWVVTTAATGILFTILGFFLSAPAPLNVSIAYMIANRLLSVVAIATTGGLTLAVLQYLNQVKASQGALTNAYDTLRSQQALLEIASDISHLGGWQVRLPEATCIWSDEVCRIHGVAPGFSPTVEQGIDFYAPEYRDSITAAFTACVHQGIPFDEELQIITTAGQRVWVRSIGQPVRNVQGQITGVQGAFQDITAQRQAEASLERSEQRFRQLADAMPMIVWTADSDGTVDYASQALRGYTGILEPQSHPSQIWNTLLHPDDRDPCTTVWMESVRTGQPYKFEFRLRRHDGDYRWHLVQAISIRGEGGEIVKWYGTAIEIHDQKQLAHEARQLAQRFNTTLESITDAFITLDRHWRFTFINHRAEQLLARDRADLFGRVIWDEFPQIVSTTFEQQFRSAIQFGRSVKFREFYAPLNLWLDVRAYPSSEGLATYFQDISDRIVLEEKLHQAQRLEAVGQLTGGIAHDFNNLLTVILGNAELLSETLETDPQLHPLAAMISSAAQRGAQLTQRLLAFARRQALEPQAVNLNQLIASMDGLLRRTLGAHIDIEMVQGAGLWSALVDPAQLESAVLNLCLNARDAMPQGGRLTLETANMHLSQDYANQHVEVVPGQYVMVAVSDTGTGIPPQYLKQVFEPFFTTKAKGKGTGLGLSMVYGFIKQSGGHIKAYSELGQGTVIRMYLPRFWGGVEPQPRRPETARDVISGRSELILLVEDDELVQRYAHDQLIDLGYRVLAVTNGPAALEMIRQRDDIDLLFTDIVMPGGMSGRDLADQAVQIRPQLKLLYTSGYTENAIVHHGRLDPGVQLLSKPYGRAELSQKIRDVLDGPQ